MFKPHFERWYIKGETYFVTTNTENKTPYFNDYGCCQIFLENLRIAKQLLNFDLYAFIIMPDHFHADICPKGEKNISQIMQYIKRHTAREINDKLKCIPNLVDKISQSCPPENVVLLKSHIQTINSIIVKNNFDSQFKWQSSFYDRRLRDEKEFEGTLWYINEKNLAELSTKYGYTKESLTNYPFFSLNTPDLIDPT